MSERDTRIEDIVRSINLIATYRAKQAISEFCENSAGAANRAENAREAMQILETLLDEMLPPKPKQPNKSKGE